MRCRTLEAEMARAGVTREELAEAVGVAPGTIGSYIRAETEPQLGTARAIQLRLGSKYEVLELFKAVD